MRIVKGGTVGSTDESTSTTYTTSDTYEDHGGTGNLWGTTWAVSDINASNFGAAFSAKKASSAGAAQTVSVDHIRITVYYTLPPVAYNQASYRVFNNQDTSSSATFAEAWGGTGNDYADPYRTITATSDGGYAMTGLVSSYGAGSFDVSLTKFDNVGNQSWTTIWGGSGSDNGYSVIQTSDGGYAVTGSTTSWGLVC